MARRLLSRLRDFGTGGVPGYVNTWSQRVCEQLEAQFANIFAALLTMADIGDTHIQADYTGAVDPARFPVSVAATLSEGETDVTTSAVWSFTTDNGGITATISAGVLAITAITQTTRVTVSATYGGITKSRSFTVYLDIAAPPSTGAGGGTTATDTSFNNISSAIPGAVSSELTVTVGSAGTVQLTATKLAVSTAAASPAGTYTVWGKWQWWNGASWVDVAAEVQSSTCSVTKSGAAMFVVQNGSLTVQTSKTGLAAGSSQKFRLMGRNNSGTRVMTLSGTASAAGS